MVAAFRGRASARETPLCSDPWALRLAGEEGLALARDFERYFPDFELWMAARTACLDAHVASWSAQGLSQVVLLGAGLDTRAARLRAPGVRFFEVDHGASQQEKQALIAAIPGYPQGAAIFVSCDFEREDFMDRLLSCGLQRELPALFLWEGVVPYLTEEAVRRGLSRIAAASDPRSVLIFDYVMRNLAERRSLRAEDAGGVEYLAQLREPVLFGTNDPLPMLYEAGFRHVRTTSFDEIVLTLTGTYERSRAFRFQHIALASCTPRSPL